MCFLVIEGYSMSFFGHRGILDVLFGHRGILDVFFGHRGVLDALFGHRGVLDVFFRLMEGYLMCCVVTEG